MLLRDWTPLMHKLVIEDQVVEWIDYFPYVRSPIRLVMLLSYGITECMRKFLLILTKLHHLWCKRDVRLSTKVWVYWTIVLIVDVIHVHWKGNTCIGYRFSVFDVFETLPAFRGTTEWTVLWLVIGYQTKVLNRSVGWRIFMNWDARGKR